MDLDTVYQYAADLIALTYDEYRYVYNAVVIGDKYTHEEDCLRFAMVVIFAMER